MSGAATGRFTGVGRRSRRPRADHPQGGPADRGGRRDRLPRRVRQGSRTPARIAAELFRAGVIEEQLRYPVTTGTTDHPGGYAGAMADFYDGRPSGSPRTSRPGATWCCWPRATRCSTAPTCTCTTGSPTASRPRSSRGHRRSRPPPRPSPRRWSRADRRAHRAARNAARAGARPPARRHRRRDHHEARPHLPRRTSGAGGGRPPRATRCTSSARRWPQQRWLPVSEVDPATVPYFSLIVVPGDSLDAPTPATRRGAPCRGLPTGPAELARRRARTRSRPRGSPPRSRAALAEVDHVVGYGAVRQPGAAARRTDPARLGQHRRGGPGPVRPRTWRGRASGSRWCPAATPACSGWRPRSSRRPRTRRIAGERPRPARGERGPGRGRAGRCPDRRRLRGDVPLRPAEAVAGGREAAPRDRRGRPGAGDLQPGLAHRGPTRSPRPQKLLLEHRSPPTPSSSWAATSAAPRSR